MIFIFFCWVQRICRWSCSPLSPHSVCIFFFLAIQDNFFIILPLSNISYVLCKYYLLHKMVWLTYLNFEQLFSACISFEVCCFYFSYEEGITCLKSHIFFPSCIICSIKRYCLGLLILSYLYCKTVQVLHYSTLAWKQRPKVLDRKVRRVPSVLNLYMGSSDWGVFFHRNW